MEYPLLENVVHLCLINLSVYILYGLVISFVMFFPVTAMPS